MTTSYALTENVDTAAAPTLASDLIALRGRDLCIDAGQTGFIGTLGLQVLLSARRQWSEDGKSLTVTPTSEAFRAALDTLGVPPGEIGVTPDPAEDGV